MLEKQEVVFLIKILENAQIKGVNALGVVRIFEKLQGMHDAFEKHESKEPPVKKVSSKK
tara:strand:- start:337 stop:513 length:177 start_codon:yes stop_codon:yes gene_type:complete